MKSNPFSARTSTPMGETSNEKSRADVSDVGVDGTTSKRGETSIRVETSVATSGRCHAPNEFTSEKAAEWPV